MENRNIAIIAVLIIALVGAGAYLAFSPDPEPEIKIAYQPSMHQVSAMVAMDHGWWEEYLEEVGITKVSYREFPSGPEQMTAMRVGELDVAYVGVAPPITAIDKGLEAKIISAVNSHGSAIVLSTDIDYENPEDLKGLTIATYSPGSVQDAVLTNWLDYHGISVGDGSDRVSIATMGAGEAVTAFRAGHLDGVFLPHPHPATLEMEGIGVIVENSGNMWPDHACCSLLVTDDLIRDNREIVEQIIKVHIKASNWVSENPMEAAEIYSKVTGFPEESAKYAFEVWDLEYVHDPHLFIESVLGFVEHFHKFGQIDQLLTEEDLFDTSFYDNVMQE